MHPPMAARRPTPSCRPLAVPITTKSPNKVRNILLPHLAEISVLD